MCVSSVHGRCWGWRRFPTGPVSKERVWQLQPENVSVLVRKWKELSWHAGDTHTQSRSEHLHRGAIWWPWTSSLILRNSVTHVFNCKMILGANTGGGGLPPHALESIWEKRLERRDVWGHRGPEPPACVTHSRGLLPRASPLSRTPGSEVHVWKLRVSSAHVGSPVSSGPSAGGRPQPGPPPGRRGGRTLPGSGGTTRPTGSHCRRPAPHTWSSEPARPGRPRRRPRAPPAPAPPWALAARSPGLWLRPPPGPAAPARRRGGGAPCGGRARAAPEPLWYNCLEVIDFFLPPFCCLILYLLKKTW